VSPKLYGDKFVTFNVHNLIHLAKDVENHGSLDEFSAFPFENKLQVLTNMLKESGRPLEQIVRRLDEENRVNASQSENLRNVTRPLTAISLEGKHFSGPLLQDTFLSCVQYRKLIFKNSFLTNRVPDNCVFVDAKPNKIIFLIENFVVVDGNIHILGKRYKKHEDLFTKPIPSTHPLLLETVVSELADVLESFPFQLVKLKAIRIPMNIADDGKFFVSPILNLDVN
jgi:hypothetical protein